MHPVPRLLSLFLIGSSFCLEARIKHIIWDLGSVLVEPDVNAKMARLGMGDCISYGISSFFSGNVHVTETLTDKMYDVLIQAGGEQTGPVALQLHDHRGVALPKLFADWQLGKTTAANIHKLVDQTLHTLRTQSYFKSSVEARLVENCIKKVTITTQGLIDGMVPGKAAKLLALFADEYDEYENSCYDFYILSNWDPESFEYLLKNSELYNEVFSYFKAENIMYSGKFGLAKPDPAFYKLLLTTYNLNAAECLFIDDQEQNIAAARNCGMNVIHWNKKDYKKILKQLRLEGLLS